MGCLIAFLLIVMGGILTFTVLFATNTIGHEECIVGKDSKGKTVQLCETYIP